jgi:hypothetical protein
LENPQPFQSNAWAMLYPRAEKAWKIHNHPKVMHAQMLYPHEQMRFGKSTTIPKQCMDNAFPQEQIRLGKSTTIPE